jgi:Mrp family chromosome partitioning ATPase
MLRYYPPNPTDLLQNGRYSELLESLKNSYDFIVLDTAPLMLVTDSLLISNVAMLLYMLQDQKLQKKVLLILQISKLILIKSKTLVLF